MLSTTFRFRFRSFVGFSTQETFKQVIKLSFNHCCKRHLKLIAIPVSGFVSRNTSGFRSIQTPYLFYHLTKSSNTRPDTRFYWNSIRAGSVLSVSASQRKKIMSGAEDEQNRKKSTKDTTSTATADSDKDGSTSAKRYVTRGNLLHDQKKEVSEAKEKFLSMDKASKRKLYKCKDKYKVLEELESWPQHFCDSLQNDKIMMHWWKTNEKHVKADIHEELNNKMSLFKGDITSLEIDAIANAANESLLGGGGVDGAIHAAAGPRLRSECELLNGCAPGEAKITCGYKLPAKHVIHTVGPRGEQPEVLKNCYVSSLNLMKKNGLQSIAFPCISTGIFGYPNLNAAKVALNTIREWLEKEEEYAQKIERIIMCLFLEVDIKVYNEQMQIYFPVNRAAHKTEESSDPDKQEG